MDVFESETFWQVFVVVLVVLVIALPIMYFMSNQSTHVAGANVGLQLKAERKFLFPSKNLGGPRNIRLPVQPVSLPPQMSEWLPEITSEARRVVAWDIIRLLEVQLKNKMPYDVVALHACGPFFELPAASNRQDEANEDVDQYHCWLVIQVEPDVDNPERPQVLDEANFFANRVMEGVLEDEKLRQRYLQPMDAVPDLVKKALILHPKEAPVGVGQLTLVQLYSDWLYGLDWKQCEPDINSTQWRPPWDPKRLVTTLFRRHLLTLTLGPIIVKHPSELLGTKLDKDLNFHTVWQAGDDASAIVERIRAAFLKHGVLQKKSPKKSQKKKQ